MQLGACTRPEHKVQIDMGNNAQISTSISKRYALLIVVVTTLVIAFLYAAGLFGGHGTTAQQFVNLQENNKPQFSCISL